MYSDKLMKIYVRNPLCPLVETVILICYDTSSTNFVPKVTSAWLLRASPLYLTRRAYLIAITDRMRTRISYQNTMCEVK